MLQTNNRGLRQDRAEIVERVYEGTGEHTFSAHPVRARLLWFFARLAWENKPCSVNAASWFPSGKPWPIWAAPSRRSAKPHHRRGGGFTLADQVNQLVGAREADPERGFMARTMALCSLPRSNPGNRLQYKRVNGPFTLIMYSSGETKLPFGNFPRLILAWVSTEAVRTPKPRADPRAVADEVHEDPGGLQ